MPPTNSPQSPFTGRTDMTPTEEALFGGRRIPERARRLPADPDQTVDLGQDTVEIADPAPISTDRYIGVAAVRKEARVSASEISTTYGPPRPARHVSSPHRYRHVRTPGTDRSESVVTSYIDETGAKVV